jgi:hypothetical protein
MNGMQPELGEIQLISRNVRMRVRWRRLTIVPDDDCLLILLRLYDLNEVLHTDIY